MLKNRLENMERERERLAATTRDQVRRASSVRLLAFTAFLLQLIAKEKHHAAELREKDYHIRQLEAQIQSLVRCFIPFSTQLLYRISKSL